MSHKAPSPPPLRALGARGATIALALWGGAAAFDAAAEPPAFSPDPQQVAEAPPVDIYGGPPTRDEPPPIEKVTSALDLLQGTWTSNGGATLAIEGDQYQLTQGRGVRERGQVEATTAGPAPAAAAVALKVRLTKRTDHGAPAPDRDATWALSADRATLTDDTGRAFTRDAPPSP